VKKAAVLRTLEEALRKARKMVQKVAELVVVAIPDPKRAVIACVRKRGAS
jgi:hypothetical protein